MCKKVTCFIVLGLAISMTSARAGLIHHWRLDEDTAAGAATAADSVGSLNGTIEGAASVPGKAGYALSFDGADDVVTVLDFVPPPQGTIAFWINPALAKSKERILGAGGDYEVWLRGNGELKNELFDSGSATTGTGAGALTANQWYHVATTYDSTTEAAEIYFDGELLVAGTAEVPSTPTETTLLLGHRGGAAAGEHYGGLLDDVRIYDHVLSEAEIKALANPPRFTARDPIPPDGAVHEDTWVNLSWTAGDLAVSHNVYLGDSFDDVNDAVEGAFQGNQAATTLVAGFPGFAYPDGLVPGTTYYWRIDEVNDAEPNSPWKGPVWSFSVPPNTAYAPDPADGAESVSLNATLNWTAGFGAKLHTVYFGTDFDDVNSATVGVQQGTTAYAPGPLELAKTYYWRVDEFDGTATYRGDVWSLTTQGAVGDPNPANAAVDVEQTPILTWTAGVYAASHQVYFGDDADAVANATKSSPEYKGAKAIGAESYDPGELTWETTYYWRIDEVNSANADSPWLGKVWSFTTANFAVIDDFESYDGGANQIWYSWHDGLGYGTPQSPPYFAGNGTGAAVGDETTASYAEETIVHGGNQSMPVAYDNNKQGFANYSQVELTLTSMRDWTAEGIAELSLWFRGDSANAPDRLYVAVYNPSGTPAVVYHEDANATTKGAWTQWVIQLQVFADQGIDLKNVDKIAVGVGTRGNTTTPGGSGKMYFDDIRLYRPKVAP
ncbi:MAG: LamG domain-containing protein [Planctomycetota bacterium]